MRINMMGALLFLMICTSFAEADPRLVEGTYRNPALGFSIQIPRGLKGVAGDEASEHGVSITLPSSGKIAVFGEANSLEWSNPAEGVRFDLTHEGCTSGKPELSPTHVGQLSGTRGVVICGDRVLVVLLAFRRPGGEPIYWLRLETVRARQSVDDAVLADIAASLKVIRWE